MNPLRISPANFISPACMIFCALLIVGCAKDGIDMVDCTGLNPTYTADIKVILNASCAISGCHDSATKQNGIDLSTYNSALGISMQDRFLGAIQHKKGFTPMPFNSPQLSQDKIDLITCWVQSGSPE